MRISTERGDCPECGDDSFAPSRAHGFEVFIKVLSPYSPFRCTICNTRFWASTGFRGYISNVLYVCLFIALLILLFSQKLFDDSSRSALQKANAEQTNAKTEIGSAISEAIQLERELNQELNGFVGTAATEKNKATLKAPVMSPPVTQPSVQPLAQVADNSKAAKTVTVSSPTKPLALAAARPAVPIKGVVKKKQQLRDTVLDQVENWRAAWENQDVARYLASYSVKFKPEQDITVAAWRRKRRATLLKPEWVKLSTSNLKTIFSNNNQRVTVSFLQDYVASNYADKTQKELVLILQGGNWNIIRERSL